VALLIAFVLAVVLSGKEAEAQTLTSDGSVSWGITTSGPSSATVSGTSLVIGAAAMTLGVAALGGPAATMALTGRALTVAGSAVGPIAMNMLRTAAARGPLTGAMLALALALGSDAVYDAASNSFKSSGTAVDLASTGWNSLANSCSPSTAAACAIVSCANRYGSRFVSVDSVVLTDPTHADVYCKITDNGGTVGKAQYGLMRLPNEPPYTAPSVPSTDAQLASAASAPSALAKVWDAGGCPQKITTYRDTVSLDDPCAKIIGAPGGVWTPVTVPNGGQITLPGRTETTVGSDGRAQTRTITPTAQVAPNADQPTMPASPVVLTPGQIDKTVVTNPDGSQTTTTTTSTGPAQKDSDKPTTTATFNGQTGTLYTKRTRTWSGVLNDFANTVKGAPWYAAAVGFFNVTIAGASCPHWTATATKWTPALDATPYVCSSTMTTLYAMGGVVVLAVAAWAAFRIAFL